jgi:uncharacterized membrane protein SpoIIM required for sporulation
MSSDPRNALIRWLQTRRATWQRVQHDSELLRRDGTADAATLRQAIKDHRTLKGDVALARQVLPDSRLSGELESLLLQSLEVMFKPAQRYGFALRKLFGQQVPAAMLAMQKEISVSVALFLATALTGWFAVHAQPELAHLVMSNKMMDDVSQGRLWTDSMFTLVPGSALAFGIMLNNIIVCLTAFCVGTIYGLGTLYMLGLNGVMLGAVFAYTHQHGMGHRLFEFIVAHGCVELTVICLSAAAGLHVGDALINPGDKSRADSFALAARRGCIVMALAIPALIGAGLIEGYVSPRPDVPLWLRLVIGIGYWIIFFLLASGIWLRRSRD